MSIWAWTRPNDGFLATPAPAYSSLLFSISLFFFFFFVYHDDHGLAIRYNYKTNQTTYNWDTQLLKVYTNSLDERPG